MNNEELVELIKKLKRVSLQLNDEIDQLQRLQHIRQATRNIGRSASARGYATHSNGSDPGTNTETAGKKYKNDNRRKLKVGDHVEVTRGRNEGTKAVIVRETASQFELESERVQGTFRKWKTNVRKIKNQEK